MVALGVADPPVCTYSAYYDDANTDTFNGDYAGVMEEYVLEGGEYLVRMNCIAQ